MVAGDTEDDEGGVLEGSGPAWFPPPDPVPPTPSWINGRAFPAVWRETLAFTVGGLSPAAAKRFPGVQPGAPWRYRPGAESAADVDQAIAAKLHLGLHTLPILAKAQTVIVEPAYVAGLPEPSGDDEVLVYAAEATLPFSPLFIDLESFTGGPVMWSAESWPFPFHLRAALCWTRDGLLCIVPYGSVGGVHPWGGVDYHAWARWLFLQQPRAEWPQPGPGDFIARSSGELVGWVGAEQESVCMQQGRVAYNLCRRVLTVLMLLEALGGEFVEPRLSRPVRRRVAREGKRIGLVPNAMPMASDVPRREVEERADDLRRARMPTGHDADTPCPLPKTHARLWQAHGLWHDALDAYADPDEFVVRLNSLIQALRTVTFVLQKELRHAPWFPNWYEERQRAMRADGRMRWLHDARNVVEKEGDLDTHSVAQVSVTSDLLDAPLQVVDVDPSSTPHEIARHVHLGALPQRLRRDGVLVIERRWTVRELDGDEILDSLAYCYGRLLRIVREAHTELGVSLLDCELEADNPCGHEAHAPHPSGRLPCMLAGREARTARRRLASGALIEVQATPALGPPPDPKELTKHYGFADWERVEPGSDLYEQARVRHEWGRRMLVADGYHQPIIWFHRGDTLVSQAAMHPEDQAAKHLMMERVATHADEISADGIIFSSEIWEAPVVDADDERAVLRPHERSDREEAFVTYAFKRGAPCRVWHSLFTRSGSTIHLADVKSTIEEDVPFLRAFANMWKRWEGS